VADRRRIGGAAAQLPVAYLWLYLCRTSQKESDKDQPAVRSLQGYRIVGQSRGLLKLGGVPLTPALRVSAAPWSRSTNCNAVGDAHWVESPPAKCAFHTNIRVLGRPHIANEDEKE